MCLTLLVNANGCYAEPALETFPNVPYWSVIIAMIADDSSGFVADSVLLIGSSTADALAGWPVVSAVCLLACSKSRPGLRASYEIQRKIVNFRNEYCPVENIVLVTQERPQLSDEFGVAVRTAL